MAYLSEHKKHSRLSIWRVIWKEDQEAILSRNHIYRSWAELMTDITDKAPGSDVKTFSILDFFANPWIGIVGSLASLVGVILAVYFYVAASRYPELVYYISPARAVVVKQGTASRLAVSFDGRPIAQDVTAAQLSIWNRGKESIRRGAILQPLVIRTDGKAPILEATIRKKSRDVVQLELNQSKMGAGELELSWNVLESGDGGLLQIVYAGGPDVGLQCYGVFEGQRAIRELRYSGTIKSPSEQMRSERRSRWALLGNGAMAILMLIVGVRKLRRRKKWDVMDIVVTTVLPVLMLGFVGYMYMTSVIPEPPFGLD